MRARSGIRRGFTRLSDRIGGGVVGISVPRITVANGNFTAPVDGDYLVSAWGGGFPGGFNTGLGGDSGAFARKKITLAIGSVLNVVVGQGGTRYFGSLQRPTATSVNGPGITLYCGPANDPGQPAAAASGGDTNLSGLLATSLSGANSPTGSDIYGPISGGYGGGGESRQDLNPAIGRDGVGFGSGGGAAIGQNAGAYPGVGAPGIVIITYLGPTS